MSKGTLNNTLTFSQREKISEIVAIQQHENITVSFSTKKDIVRVLTGKKKAETLINELKKKYQSC